MRLTGYLHKINQSYFSLIDAFLNFMNFWTWQRIWNDPPNDVENV